MGGAFLLIPVMVYFLGLPMRAAIGSSLGVVLVSSAAGAVAKIGTGQVVLSWAAALVAGALPGTWLGAYTSLHVSARGLRLALAVLVALTAIRMLVDVLVSLRLSPNRAFGTP